jgi:rhodanese-related sulfurtransferase
MQNIKTTAELEKILLENNSENILLDVRTPQEFNQGHIQGAVNFDISHSNIITEMEEMDKSKTYIIYCRSGGRSGMASMIMDQKGLKVMNCTFGFMHLRGSQIKTTK